MIIEIIIVLWYNLIMEQNKILNKIIEKKLLSGEIKLNDILASLKPDDFPFIFSKLKLQEFPKDYFLESGEDIYYSKKFCVSKFDSVNKPPFKIGLITADGTIYNATDFEHLRTCTFLKLNGIDLHGCLRYRISNSEVLLYPGYGSVDRTEDETSIENFCNSWEHFYDNFDYNNNLIELTANQVKTIRTLVLKQSANNDDVIYGFLLSLVKQKDLFGLLKPSHTYPENLQKIAKYNKLTFQDYFGLTQEDFENIKYHTIKK